MEESFQVDGYKILERLGQGGMGLVFKATKDDMLYAIKFLSPDLSTKREYIDWFMTEASIALQLDHPNIVRGIEYGLQTSHFLVMEFVPGSSVREILRRQKIEVKQACQILLEIAKALEYTQSLQLVHRDIKPANIIVDEDAQVKLCDLGLAKSCILTPQETLQDTRPNKIHGTVHYMSPEQACNRKMDIHSDIYSLGITFYHMLTGSVPYKGSKKQIMEQHVKSDLPDPREVVRDIPSAVVQILEKMTAKKSEDRYSPSELLQNLETLTGDTYNTVQKQEETDLSTLLPLPENKRFTSMPDKGNEIDDLIHLSLDEKLHDPEAPSDDFILEGIPKDADQILLTLQITDDPIDEPVKKVSPSGPHQKDPEISIICLACQSLNSLNCKSCFSCGALLTYNDKGIIKLRCSCGKRISISQKLIGKQGNCPSCQKSISIPDNDSKLLGSSSRKLKQTLLVVSCLVITFGTLIYLILENSAVQQARIEAAKEAEKNQQRVELEKIKRKYAHYPKSELEEMKQAYAAFRKKYPDSYYAKDVEITIAGIDEEIEQVVRQDYKEEASKITNKLLQKQFQNALTACEKLEKNPKYEIVRREIFKLKSNIIEQNNKSLRLKMSAIDQQVKKGLFKKAYNALANAEDMYLTKDATRISDTRKFIHKKNQESLDKLIEEIRVHVQNQNVRYALIIVEEAERNYLPVSYSILKLEKQAILQELIAKKKQTRDVAKKNQIPKYNTIEWCIYFHESHFDISSILAILELKQKSNSLKDINRAYTNLLNFAQEDKDPAIQRAQVTIKHWLFEYINTKAEPEKMAMDEITLQNGNVIVGKIVKREADSFSVEEKSGTIYATTKIKKSRIKLVRKITRVSLEEQKARLDFKQLLSDIENQQYIKATKTLRRIIQNDRVVIKNDIRFQMDTIWDTNPKLLFIYPPPFILSLSDVFEELNFCSKCRDTKEVCNSCSNTGLDLADETTRRFIESQK